MSDREVSFLIGQKCETLNILNFKVCNGTASIMMVTFLHPFYVRSRKILKLSNTNALLTANHKVHVYQFTGDSGQYMWDLPTS